MQTKKPTATPTRSARNVNMPVPTQGGGRHYPTVKRRNICACPTACYRESEQKSPVDSNRRRSGASQYPADLNVRPFPAPRRLDAAAVQLGGNGLVALDSHALNVPNDREHVRRSAGRRSPYRGRTDRGGPGEPRIAQARPAC